MEWLDQGNYILLFVFKADRNKARLTVGFEAMSYPFLAERGRTKEDLEFLNVWGAQEDFKGS